MTSIVDDFAELSAPTDLEVLLREFDRLDLSNPTHCQRAEEVEMAAVRVLTRPLTVSTFKTLVEVLLPKWEQGHLLCVAVLWDIGGAWRATVEVLAEHGLMLVVNRRIGATAVVPIHMGSQRLSPCQFGCDETWFEFIHDGAYFWVCADCGHIESEELLNPGPPRRRKGELPGQQTLLPP